MRLFKDFAILFLIVLALALPSAAQRRRPSRAQQPRASAAQTSEQAATAFEAIKSTADVNERVEKLEAFIKDFPNSDLKPKAIEFLIVTHVAIGENDFREDDAANGIAEFRDAAKAFAPEVSENLFNDVVAKLPYNVYFRAKLPEDRAAAIEIARIIEPKVRDNSARLLALANFYLTIENAAEAKRIAARAAQIQPDSAAAEFALATASRIDLDLEAAARHFERAAELDKSSQIAKRNLADAKRGIGRSEEALNLYRELLAANPADEAARSGLILTLFDLKQKAEAEKELNAALEQNPRNFQLAANAAYWYAANNDGARAIELANKAIETEPRFVWAQIALARGLMLQKQPLAAERALLFARQFGNFPTLDYELANAHLAAGLFDEARDDLKRSFAVKNGKLATRLANRRDAQADDFNRLLAAERRASTFQFQAANTDEENKKLRELLELSDALAADADENKLAAAAANFAEGTDEMRAHRGLYAANRLLERKKALSSVADLTKAAIADLDRSLDAPAATAATLADELYEPRRAAQARGELLNVPTLDRATLSKILRGRVEEIAGWTLFQENKFDEAAVRLRRAVGILPQNSAWWRASLWKLGLTLDAAGKPREALDPLISSYKADQPSEVRLATIKAVYQRANNTLAGLEERLSGTTAAAQNSAAQQQQRAANNPNLRAARPNPSNPLPSVIAEIVPKTAAPPNAAAANQLQTKPEPTPAATPTEVIATQAVETANAGQTATKQPDSNNLAVAQPTPNEKLAQAQSEPTTTTSPTETNVAEAAEKPAETPIQETIENRASTAKPEETVAKTEESAKTEPPKIEEAAKTESVKIDSAKTEETSAPRVVIVPVNQTAPEQSAPQETVNKTLAAIESPQQTRTENAATSRSAGESTVLPKPRVVVQNINEAAENSIKNAVRPEARAICAMQISQKQVVVSRNGGAATLIVSVGNAENAANLNFTVSSPTDIAVASQDNRAANDFTRSFQIRSISEITKTFVVTFESPCGRQDVLVKVR